MLYAIQGLLKHHEVNTNLASAISLGEDKKMGSNCGNRQPNVLVSADKSDKSHTDKSSVCMQ